ncbi:MAG: GlsB/YeaQ/YmgE family stress response membrane protein [Planctomycetaceae bacterium]
MNILYYVIVGIVAGFLAGKLTKGSGFGLLGNLVVGILGAIVGGFAFGLLGVQANGTIGEIVTATVGAILLLFLVTMVAGKK